MTAPSQSTGASPSDISCSLPSARRPLLCDASLLALTDRNVLDCRFKLVLAHSGASSTSAFNAARANPLDGDPVEMLGRAANPFSATSPARAAAPPRREGDQTPGRCGLPGCFSRRVGGRSLAVSPGPYRYRTGLRPSRLRAPWLPSRHAPGRHGSLRSNRRIRTRHSHHSEARPARYDCRTRLPFDAPFVVRQTRQVRFNFLREGGSCNRPLPLRPSSKHRNAHAREVAFADDQPPRPRRPDARAIVERKKIRPNSEN